MRQRVATITVIWYSIIIVLTWKLRCNDNRSVPLLPKISLSHINYGCVIFTRYSMRFSIKRKEREIIQILEYSKHLVFCCTLITHFSPHIPDVINICALLLPHFFFTHSSVIFSSVVWVLICNEFSCFGSLRRYLVVNRQNGGELNVSSEYRMIIKKDKHSLDDELLKSVSDRFQSLLADLSVTLVGWFVIIDIHFTTQIHCIFSSGTIPAYRHHIISHSIGTWYPSAYCCALSPHPLST